MDGVPILGTSPRTAMTEFALVARVVAGLGPVIHAFLPYE